MTKPLNIFLSADEMATLNLTDLPSSKRGFIKYANRHNWHHMRASDGTPLARKRKGRGGGFEFCTSLLPLGARAIAERKYAHKAEKTLQTEVQNGVGFESLPTASDTHGLVGGTSWNPEITPNQPTIDQLWEDYDKLNQNRKDIAHTRLMAVIDFFILKEQGETNKEIAKIIYSQHGISRTALYRHLGAIKGHVRQDWLAILAPRIKGDKRLFNTPINHDVWEYYKALYLRPEKPTSIACYRHLEQIAVDKDWGTLPQEYRLRRKLQDEVPMAVQILLREGEKSLEAMYPAMIRTRDDIGALDIVNFDGHTWDVFVKDTDGTIFRPIMTAVQDIYSGKVLAWRFSRSADKYTTQLVVADMVKDYGVPNTAVFDNGRDFTSKMITGGAPNRFRFKIKEDEPTGVVVALGCKIHFTLPYSGKSKPIERVFRDFAGDIAKHPAFAGAYVGNTPMAKPDNYGNTAIDFAEFQDIVNREITLWNSRTGRKGGILNGRSCDAVFKESYEVSTIKRATESQMRMCLLAGEPVTVNRKGRIKVMDTEYWAPWLMKHVGEKVVVRFDPENLHQPVYIYALDSTFMGELEPQFKGQFMDAQAAQTHNRKRREFIKNTKKQSELAKELGIDQVAESLRGQPTPETETIKPGVAQILTPKVSADQQRRKEMEDIKQEYDADNILELASLGLAKANK